METFEYRPIGVCANLFIFTINKTDNTIENLKIVGGCPGYSKGIVELLKGMNIVDIINKLKDIKCGLKNTSCPAQIAKALESYMNQK